MNKIFLIGNLTRDPELSEAASGTPICRFSIAVNRRRSSRDNADPQVDYFRVTAFRNLAENVARFVKKGNKVAVVGTIQIQNVEDSSGQRRTYVDVIADDVEFLTPKNSGPNDDYTPAQPPVQRRKPVLQEFEDNEDIPF